MNKVAGRLIALFVLSTLASTSCSSDDYLGTLRDAVSSIEVGAYDDAASSIERVLALDDSDPLGHTALAVVYMHTGRLDDAESELGKVIEASPDDWRPHYALGLTAVARNETGQAAKYFAAARKFSNAREELSVTDVYLDLLGGNSRHVDELAGETSVVSKQIAAMRALKSGKREEAASLLVEVLSAPAAPGFEESHAPLVTFDAARPIFLPQGKLTWRRGERRSAPIVSGVVNLRGETSRARGVDFVMFYIDDVFVGVTNYEPFQFEWNTENYSNGLHNVRIEAKNQAGYVISSKSVYVSVSNANPRRGKARRSREAIELAERLWDCVRVKESRALAHYHLAKLYLESGDTENAIRQFEYAMAYDPNVLDARELANRLRGREPRYIEMNQSAPGSGRVALTFDDGPNERTGEMLEMLAKLGVPATFFLVGFRAEEQPELTRAIQAAGHEIENHSYTHPNLTTLTADEVEAQLSKTSAVIRAITGKPSAYFRPPGGHIDRLVRRAAARQGFTGVFWTINCSPFQGARCDELAGYVLDNIRDGGIVLMHNGDPATIAALPRIVGELRRRGYRFVTISDMASDA